MRQSRKFWGLALLLLLLLATALGGYGYQRYVHAKASLGRAQEHAVAAEAIMRDLQRNPMDLDSARIESLIGESMSARDEISTVAAEAKRLDPFLEAAAILPIVGNDAKAAQHLIRMLDRGLQGWDAAPELIRMAFASLYDPNERQGGERVLRATEASYSLLDIASMRLREAEDEYKQIPSEGLFSTLARARDVIGQRLPNLVKAVETTREGAQVLSETLGADGERTYLILIQDTGEIRPTGGFIGNYGIIKVSRGRIVDQKFADTYTLDWPYYYAGKSSPPVAMFARYFPESTFLALRDSNMWPDFPTSARQAARFAIEEGAADHIDGVIAITPALAKRLLKVTGPVVVPGFEETATEDNFEDRIRYYQNQGPPLDVQERLGDQFVPNRKLFTSLLIKTLVQKLATLDVHSAPVLFPELQEAAKEKDVMAYFEDAQVQRLVEDYGLGGETKPSPGDYLWIVDMNVSGSKDNLFVQEGARYDVTIAPEEGATSELTITYDYTKSGGAIVRGIMRDYYGDYLRVYVPAGSVFVQGDGLDEKVETQAERGKTVFATFLKIYPGTTRTVKLRYKIPLKIWQSDPEKSYHLVVQKQPASMMKPIDIRVALPPGSTVTSHQEFTADNNKLWYHGALATDLDLTATFKLH